MDVLKNRIAEGLWVRNMKQVELSEKTGIPKASINSWKLQRWQPKQKALAQIAEVLDVSEMWLAGYDVPMERPAKQKEKDTLIKTIQLVETNKRYQDLINAITTLTDEQIELIESMVKQFININKEV